MKVRHGTLTGSLSSDTGVYLTGDNSAPIGARGVYLGLEDGEKEGRVIRLWPADNTMRVSSLVLTGGDYRWLEGFSTTIRTGSSSLYFVRLKIGNRVWRRDETRKDIEFGAGGIRFLRNCGPFADSVFKGQRVELELGYQTFHASTHNDVDRDDWQELRHTIRPAGTCDIVLQAGWGSNGGQGGIGIKDANGNWVKMVEGGRVNNKGKGGIQHFVNEEQLLGVSGGPWTVWVRGPRDASAYDVKLYATSAAMNVEISRINVEEV